MPIGVYERVITPLAIRLWRHVNKDGPIVRPELGPCWVWTAATQGAGYGVVGVEERGSNGRPKTKLAHRASWEMANGPIPDGLFVCHKCDNPPCVRGEHLFLGTDVDNTNDKVAKGRQARGWTMASAQQSSPRRIDNTSGFKGVYRDRRRDQYIARISANNQTSWLGAFSTDVAAALAYDKAARKHYGPDAFTNFKPSPITNTIISNSLLAHLNTKAPANDTAPAAMAGAA